jgi:hypothetical protein
MLGDRLLSRRIVPVLFCIVFKSLKARCRFEVVGFYTQLLKGSVTAVYVPAPMTVASRYGLRRAIVLLQKEMCQLFNQD